LNASSAVSSSIASVEEYWSSQTAEIRPSLYLKYGAVGRKATMLATSYIVEEELVEKSDLLWGDEEGHGFVIFGRYAVCRVVLLEVEQAACKKGMMTIELEWDVD
jgi:hypothetical protein